MAQGAVYFFESTDPHLWPFVKIGFTCGSICERLKSVQTSCPFELRCRAWIDCVGVGRREKTLHVRFAASHAIGEWYKASPALLAYIEEVHRLGPVEARI